jgi:hypothetical protein
MRRGDPPHPVPVLPTHKTKSRGVISVANALAEIFLAVAVVAGLIKRALDQ